MGEVCVRRDEDLSGECDVAATAGRGAGCKVGLGRVWGPLVTGGGAKFLWGVAGCG